MKPQATMSPQKQRLIIMILAGFFGLLIIVGLIITFMRSQQGKVTIKDVTPSDSVMKLDGQEIKKGTHYITPGKHQFVVTRQVFKEQKIDFEIKGGETREFEFFLFSDESAGLEWNLQNPEEAAKLDGEMSRRYEEAVDRSTKYEIMNDLPIIDRYFRIDKGLSEKGNDFALYIQSGTEEGKADALATLEYMGYDPKNFEIIYTKPE
jgi:hypothetical protein